MVRTHDGRITCIRSEKKHGLDLDPASLTAQASLGCTFYYAREYGRALAQLQRALEMDSSFAMARGCLAKLYEQKKMYPEAIAEWQKMATAAGGTAYQASLAHAYAVSANRKAAREILEELLSHSRESLVAAKSLAEVYVGLGLKNSALEWLEKIDNEEGPVTLKVDPAFDDLHSDPRFVAILGHMNLSP